MKFTVPEIKKTLRVFRLTSKTSDPQAIRRMQLFHEEATASFFNFLHLQQTAGW